MTVTVTQCSNCGTPIPAQEIVVTIPCSIAQLIRICNGCASEFVEVRRRKEEGCIQKFIAKAREIEAKATRGPWEKRWNPYASPLWTGYSIWSVANGANDKAVMPVIYEKINDCPDSELIAFARNNLPRILDVLEMQAAALEFYSGSNYESAPGGIARKSQREVTKILRGRDD